MSVEKSVSEPLVHILILNWNGWKDTVDCLSSLEKLNYSNYEIVVIDNGSTDQSEFRIRDAYPGVTLLQTHANLGFAGGNNVGIEYAIEHGAKFVWLLNNDTTVSPEALRFLVTEALSDGSVSMVGSKIYYYDQPRRIWFAGGTVRALTSKTEHIGMGETDIGQYDVPRDVDYVTGCSMLVSRRMVDKVGLMDQRFFLYFEEADWATRARQAGLRVRYAPKSVIWHKISRSAELDSPRMVFHFSRSSMLYAKKHISERPVLPFLLFMTFWVLRPAAHGKLRSAIAGIRGLLSGIMDA